MIYQKAGRIYLFGGSFNPPHVGHVEICRYLAGRRDADGIWVIPCYKHPFGKELAPFKMRVHMCRLAFRRFGREVVVSEVERKLGGISHTVKTIEYLVGAHPEKRFVLVIGADVAGEKADWENYDKIIRLAETIEIPRGKGSQITDISSTKVREMLSTGGDVRKYLPKDVWLYIKKHKLYLQGGR